MSSSYRSLFLCIILVSCQVDNKSENSNADSDTLAYTSEETDTIPYIDTFTVRRPASLTIAEQAEFDSLQDEAAEFSALINKGHVDEEKASVAINEEIIATNPDAPAYFPGGDAGLKSYINRHLFYPPAAYQSNVKGTVMVRFVVETDGSITGVTIVKSLEESCDAMAKRVIEAMPLWTPAKKSGKSVRTVHTIPLSFNPDK